MTLEYVSYKDHWKSAIVEMRERGLTYGDKISHDEMYSLLGLETPESMSDYMQIRKAQLAYMHNVEMMRAELLEEDQMDMQSLRGFGFEIIHPNQQTARAFDDLLCDMKRAIKKSARRINCIDMAQLTEAEKRENTDARAKLSFFRRNVRKRIGI